MLRDPFSTLPCEIASEIFVHCLPTSYTDREWNTANPREAPMLLLHVCRIWREIAIGTPALWAKMELSMHNAHCHDTALACLKRAKACPLAVKLHHWARGEIDEEDTWSDKEDEYSWLISPFQTLLGCAHNLKFLELSAIPLGYMRELDRLSGSCNFPLLQKLAIGVEAEVWSDESEGELRPCVQLFANAPLLCELSLIGDTPPVFLGSLPWNQLTKYTGTTNHLDLCIEALRLGTNLVECALAANGIDGDFVGILIHSSLKSLTFFSHEWWCSTDILRFLTLPALESLRILDCPNEWFQYREFLEFLTRSSPPLRQFAIRLDPRTALSVDIVLAMSGLVELEIWNPHDTFFTAFFSYFDAVAVLPQLQHLSFFHPHHSSKKCCIQTTGGSARRINGQMECQS
ncbi:F-box domain-containing protein [Mycena sanguinolenta]|uniref:F-box domain-containing protein n=1 Tax=Mycena sanguinolenta TaxID=230812 RepID=A0A8H6XTC8_9AGAR|nr:F-box domain-containing protein [Mycena sanguinolenta]